MVRECFQLQIDSEGSAFFGNKKRTFLTLGNTKTSEIPELYKGGFGGTGGVAVENLNLKSCLNLVEKMTSRKIIIFIGPADTEREIILLHLSLCVK